METIVESELGVHRKKRTFARIQTSANQNSLLETQCNSWKERSTMDMILLALHPQKKEGQNLLFNC